MQRVVRAFPVKSREALLEFARGVDEWPDEAKQPFFDNFGGVSETWHFQMIEGKPYVIGVADGERLEQGFERYAGLKDPFSLWFKAKVLEISGADLNEEPKGPPSEMVYELCP